MQIAEKFQSHGRTSNPKSSPFNRLTFSESFPANSPPRSGDTMRGREGGRTTSRWRSEKLARPIDWETLQPTAPLPSNLSRYSILNSSLVNQPSSTSSTVFPEVVCRRNKSCRFYREREKNNRRQTIQREAFVRDNNHPFSSPSSSPPWLERFESPAETAVIFGSHCPKVRGISSLARIRVCQVLETRSEFSIFERFDWNGCFEFIRERMGKWRNETIVLFFFFFSGDWKLTSGKVWRCNIRGDDRI